MVDLAISDLRDAGTRNLTLEYEAYLKTYFPRLTGEVVGDNLVVRNRGGQSIAIFQDAGDKFRVADKANLLDYGGGTSCDASGLFNEMATLNSKT